MSENAQLNGLCGRFRGFYPVVIDVETAGFNAKTDAPAGDRRYYVEDG